MILGSTSIAALKLGSLAVAKAMLGTTEVWSGLDPDAAAYIAAVEAADGQALEDGVKTAYNNFIKGCKSDGIWDAIKASCILAGARTLSGALVPLRGTAPTNYNFVSGDYNRKTGLIGDGSTKYLNSNRSNNDDPQNSKHLSVFRTTSETRNATRVAIGNGLGSSGDSQLITTTTLRIYRVNYNTGGVLTDSTTNAGFWGASRSTASTIIGRYNGTSTSYSDTSVTPTTSQINVYTRDANAPAYTNARLSFYSIGESLDLAALDSRVSTLMSDLAAAIP